MVKSLLMSIFLLGIASTTITGNYRPNGLAANGNQSTASPYTGQYKGEWVARPIGLNWYKNGADENTGTWDITIDSNGEITGTETDEMAGKDGAIKGFIDEKGLIDVSVKYRNTSRIKGKLEKKGIRLIGNLQQYCKGDDDPCLKIEMTLKRK